MKNNKTEELRKCPQCGKYDTLEPKKHEYFEETRELALKIYYSGVSARGVARILKMNKSNIANWIKKKRNVLQRN